MQHTSISMGGVFISNSFSKEKRLLVTAHSSIQRNEQNDFNKYCKMNEVVIPLSKRKTILAVVGAGLFIGIGCLMAINPENFSSAIFRNIGIIRIVGIAGFVFFGGCFIFIGRKLFDDQPGLIIDQYGITNNSNVISMGLIEWDDITGMEKKQVMSTSFLILHTDKPEKYAARIKNSILKSFVRMSCKMYGSPISITTNSLKINYNDLEKLIASELKKRRHIDF